MQTDEPGRPARTGRAPRSAARRAPAPGAALASGPPAGRSCACRSCPPGRSPCACVDASGDILIANEILQPGNPSRTYRSKRFRLVLGNNQATLKINGTNRTVPPSGEVIAYTITRNGRRDLPAAQRPTCAG